MVRGAESGGATRGGQDLGALRGSAVQWHQFSFPFFWGGCPAKNGPSPKKASLFPGSLN